MLSISYILYSKPGYTRDGFFFSVINTITIDLQKKKQIKKSHKKILLHTREYFSLRDKDIANKTNVGWFFSQHPNHLI